MARRVGQGLGRRFFLLLRVAILGLVLLGLGLVRELGDATRERLQQAPPPWLRVLTGELFAAGEEAAAGRLLDLSPEERMLLWELVLEPSVEPGLRCQLLRVLERVAPDAGGLEGAVGADLRASSWEAAVLLGRRGRVGDRPVLEDALARWRGWGRQYAIVGLVLLGDPAAAPAIREAASDPSPSVRRHVVLALAELGDPEDRLLFDELARRLPDPPTLRVVLHGKRRLRERFPPVP